MGKLGWVVWMCVCVSLGLKMSGVAAVGNVDPCAPMLATDNDLLQFALNLEFLEAEFFLFGALGRGLDAIDPTLAGGGPPPVGARAANLDSTVRAISEEFGYQEIGHLRAIINRTIGSFARPLLNLSREAFADVMDRAVGTPLSPPFDPYANSLNFLIAANLIPYVGLGGMVGAIPRFILRRTRMLAASLLGVEAGQDAVIRTLLYLEADRVVPPYNITVARFTNVTSSLYNKLGNCGVKNEGLRVPRSFGAENRTESNILAADSSSLSYARTPPEILRALYGTGDARIPGGFYPRGGNGGIARRLLRRG